MSLEELVLEVMEKENCESVIVKIDKNEKGKRMFIIEPVGKESVMTVINNGNMTVKDLFLFLRPACRFILDTKDKLRIHSARLRDIEIEGNQSDYEKYIVEDLYPVNLETGVHLGILVHEKEK